MKAWQVENDTASVLEAVDEGGGDGSEESMFSSVAPAIAKVLMFKLGEMCNFGGFWSVSGRGKLLGRVVHCEYFFFYSIQISS